MTHKKFEKLMLEAFYEELPPDERTRFQDHLNTCPQCAEIYGRMAATLRTMQKRQRPEPDEAYWNGYWSRLEPALGQESNSRKKRVHWIERLQDALHTERRLAYAFGAAALCVAAGIVIGRFVIQPEVPSRRMATNELLDQHPDSVRIEQAKRTAEYLDRSRTLLLGIINVDTAGAGAPGADLSKQKAVSRELVNEARVLQADLKGSDQAQLRMLVSELEVIMLQIANLEARYAYPAIQMVRNGVDRSAILLKINLEQMQMDTRVKKDGKPNS